MPDSFNNARAYFDPTFPSSGDSFSLSGFRNAFAGLGFLDMIPLQPRAHSPGDMRVMVRGQDASNFFNPVYFGDANDRIPFSSGDTTAMSAPASNPRIDIVYLTPSGDIKVQTGTEAASPTLPSLAPSGDTRFPICAIWHKVGETKIVNFEDKDSNSGDGYIYKDLRPWMRSAGAGAAKLSVTTPVGITGDNAIGSDSGASRANHRHQGVHTVRVVGSGDIFGDVTLSARGGTQLIQSGNEVAIYSPPMSAFETKFMHIQDQKSAGTNGGTFTSGSWQTRILNTILINEISGSSLTSNQITLPPGTYYIEAFAIGGNNIVSHKAKFANITDGIDQLIGMTMQGTTGVDNPATLRGRFTINGTKVFELQHYCTNTIATTGFGTAINISVVEIYAEILIWRIG